MHKLEDESRGSGAELIAVIAVVMWLVTVGLWAGSVLRGEGVDCDDLSMRVDVNHADSAKLQLLPGIGPKLAGQIIAYRAENRLEEPADLLRVSGIGAITAERIGPYVEFR